MHLEESSKEGYGSKRAVLPMMMMKVKLISLGTKLKIELLYCDDRSLPQLQCHQQFLSPLASCPGCLEI
jgi:hypothetical protein